MEKSHMTVFSRRTADRSLDSRARAVTTVTRIADFADRGVDVSSKTDWCGAKYANESEYGLLVAATAVEKVRC